MSVTNLVTNTLQGGASLARKPSCLLAFVASLCLWASDARAEAPLWGWADLHAQPATHLALGADAAGNGGIFWGKPGLNLEVSRITLLADLQMCAADKHRGYDADAVRHVTQTMIIGAVENVPGFTHGPSGARGFSSWPHALSRTHQQMHVTAIRRAYEGGQRLMIASATDSEVLSALWTKIGYNALGNPVPLPDPTHDFESARRQIAFIKELAHANAGWMEVAYSAADARRIVASNKLAVILSVELDSLTPAQTLRLVRDYGVRHVIPVHLVDNEVGGAAVYDNTFNTANAFYHATRGVWNNFGPDGFFDVEYDRRLRGRLGRPQLMYAVGSDLIRGGAVLPREVTDAEYATLGYDLPPERGGHKNARSLSPAGAELFRELARLGVLIDIAHMGEKTAEATVRLARLQGYPIMDSHTGLRAPDETAGTERALMRAHARAIADLGGVIGLGTEGTSGLRLLVQQPIVPQPGRELVRFTGSFTERAWAVSSIPRNPVVSHLTVTIRTGGDDLRGGNNRVWARVDIDGRISEWDLSRGAKWANGSVHGVTIRLPAGTRADSIRSFALRTDGNARNSPFDSPDNWNVDDLRVEATLALDDGVATWLNEYRDLLSVMHGRGATMGTDLNGLAPQLPFATQPVTYPITVSQHFGRGAAPALPRAVMGDKTFDFQRDGIAHYGMLADFVQALSQKPDSATAIGALYRSANDVVEMWERCEWRRGFEGDFNGDGRTDVAVWRPATHDWAVNLSTGTDFAERIWTGAWASDGPVHVGDFNGDGRSDLMMWRAAGGDWTVNLSTGSGFLFRRWTGAAGSDGPIHVGDFNGDGRTDVMMWRERSRDWAVNLSTGSGFTVQTWRGAWGSDGPIHVGDFNGDGKTDVMMWRRANRDWTVNLSTGSGFTFQVWTGAWGSDGPIQVGDFNGDGKTDVMMWREANRDWTVNLSTGSGFRFRVWTGYWGSDGPIEVGDFNGDGKTDVIMWRQATRDWTLNLSTGTGFNLRNWRGAWGSDGPVHLGDFNGDGRTDIVMWRQAANDWTVNLSRRRGFEFLVW